MSKSLGLTSTTPLVIITPDTLLLYRGKQKVGSITCSDLEAKLKIITSFMQPGEEEKCDIEVPETAGFPAPCGPSGQSSEPPVTRYPALSPYE